MRKGLIVLILIVAMAVSIGSAQIESVYYCYSNGEWRYCTPEETILAEKAGTTGTLRYISDDEIRSLLFSPRLSLGYNCNLATQTVASAVIPEPTPVVTPVYQKMAYRYSFTWPPVTYPTCPPCPPATPIPTPTPPVPDPTSCTNDAQCVAAQCCHPTSCINSLYRPNCSGVACTAVCTGPLDCGAGQCRCVNGKCQVVPGPGPSPSPTQTPTTTGVYISDLNVTAEYVRLTNPGPNFVVLTGWTIADNAGRRVRFVKTTTPSGAMVDSTIQGYSTLTLITGRAGVSTPTVIYYPLEMWNDTGDTAYLYNAAGTLVSTMTR